MTRNREKISRSVDGIFFVLIAAAALVLACGAVYLNWQKAQEADRLARQNRRAVTLMRQFQLTLVEAESSLRGHLLSADKVQLRSYNSALKDLEAQLDELEALGGDIASIAERFPEIRRLVEVKINDMGAAVQAAAANDWEFAASLVDRGAPNFERLRATAAQIERATVDEGERFADETLSKIQMATLLAVSCCIVLFLLFAAENQRATTRRKAAELASETKSAFLASMSHELRTPLNAVIGYSQMLQEEAEADGRTSDFSDLKKIESAGKHLLELINSILEMSKIEAGKVEVRAEAFPVSELLSTVTELVKPMAAKNANQLEVTLEPGVDRMYSDEVKVRQCLLNLLSNAAKFTSNGTVKLHVERIQQDGRPILRFAVSDTGPGIAPGEMTRLFEPFHQVDSSPVRTKGQGTGLGLAITRRLSQMLGGEVKVESLLGVGTTFTLDLPEELTAGALSVARPPRDTEAPSILVIDDDTAIHGLLTRLLEKHPVQVAVARNGEEGIRMARELNPRAITLDIIMEGADGWEVLRRLKSDPVIARIPVILLSILDAHGDPRGLLAAEVFSKPVDIDRLSEAILRHAAAGRATSALIVDDNPESRQLLRRPLDKLGWRIFEASNGEEALELCEREQPGLVLLDLLMPGVDGFEVLSRLRATDSGRDTPVLVVTAMDLNEAQQERLRMQAAAIMNKNALRGNELIAQVLATLETQ